MAFVDEFEKRLKDKEFSVGYDKKTSEKLYSSFQQQFGKDYLINNNLNDKKLLIHLFGSKDLSNGQSLKYILERDESYRKFGSIKGTYDFNYPIRYSSDIDTWIISECSRETQKEVTTDVAIHELFVVKNEFIDIFNMVEKLIPFKNIGDYIELDSFIKDNHRRLYNKMWVVKYLHMLYPDYFSNFFNNRNESDWLPVLVKELKLEKISNSKIICNGQVSLFARSYNITNYEFSLLAYQYFRDNKHTALSPFYVGL